ncbi:hypothetical protein B1A99_24770 [Cohnella sp. CIP 111063]|uniref:hypothetical protein n=1 Tax=unclassified Cohnella TaxID=2636738 RepID=UPI000B8C0E4F|nr:MULTISPECIES: hypothetical protein [unclassified Cohnella]OXS54997.1 hypothetical protein B1A99_24770 [Cohnella sp. CIP 111063]PRX65132.1 hypothetical protein B0G52_11883 [Cohnella sp. SGD-V74]
MKKNDVNKKIKELEKSLKAARDAAKCLAINLDAKDSKQELWASLVALEHIDYALDRLEKRDSIRVVV